ncbi:MAG: hypothetical protein U0176_22375 [Bacteroidia bacterium]
MKKNIALALGICGMIAFTSCTRENGIKPEKILKPTATASARYVVPLTTGRPNGETDIVDPTNATRTNIAELLPTMRQIIADAKLGRIPSYPDAYSTDSENNPKTFMQRALKKIESTWRPVSDQEMLTSFEMNFDLEAYDGYIKMKPTCLDVTFVDSKQMYPDYIVCSLKMSDLKDYPVRHGAGTMPLPDYLAEHAFEHYVIRVFAADTFGIRTFADSRTVQQQLEQGHFDVQNPWQLNKQD